MKQHRKHIWKRGLVSFLAAMLVLNLCAPAVMTRAEELSGQDPAIQTPAAAGQGTIPMTWEDLGKFLEQGIAAAKTTPDDTANTGSSEETPGEGTTGEGTTSEGATGEGTSGVGTTGEGTTGEGTSSEGTTGEGTTGEGTTGVGTTGEGTTGEGTSGVGTTGEGTTGEGTSGVGTTGEGTTGEGTSGEGTTGEGATGEGTSGEGTTGEGTSGEGTEPAEGTQELLNYLLSARTYEELDAMMENMSEEDYVVLNQFNEEQNAALSAHVAYLNEYDNGALADLIIAQGETATHTVQAPSYYNYSCRVSQNGEYVYSSGITVSASGGTITIEVSETTAPGEYDIVYGYSYSFNSFNQVGRFTISVVEPSDDSGTTTGPVVETKKMSYEKTATARDDGTYDLELTLSGSVGSKNNKAKLDVIFIVDNSNSMYPNYSTYMQSLRPAMQSLVTNMSETNGEKIDAQYAIVRFGTEAQIYQNFSDAATTKQNIGNIRQYSSNGDGGTNYQYGIYQGKNLLNASTRRKDATTVVIFVTDGLPTYRGINSVNGNGQNDDSKYNINAAVSEIEGMSCNYFYCIGIGSNFTNSSKTEYKNMSKLTEAVNASYTGIYGVSNGEVSELNTVFNGISSDVTTFLCSDVTITDTLHHVDSQLMVDVTDPSTVMVTVYKGDEVLAGPAASVTLPETDNNVESELKASYNSETHQLTLDFPDAYQLEPDYTYKLSCVIKPTEKAYEEYRKTNYTDIGGEGTGTHSGERGFYANDEAIISYSYEGNPGTAKYNKPVIQLHPGKLVINKTIEGLTEEQIPNMSFHVELTYPGATSATEVDIPLSEFTLENGTYTYDKFVGLSPETTYTVTENGYQVDGYNVKTTVNGQESVTATGSVAKDTEVTLNFTNAYSLANTTITLDKNVAGNMASYTDEFIFNVTIAGEAYTGNPIKLTHLSDPVQITVPIGAEVTITEQASGSYVATATVDNKKEDLSGEIDKTLTIESVAAEGHSVVFTNTNEKVVETGIHTDTYATYVMMSAMIVLAGFLMLGKARYTGKF